MDWRTGIELRSGSLMEVAAFPRIVDVDAENRCESNQSFTDNTIAIRIAFHTCVCTRICVFSYACVCECMCVDLFHTTTYGFKDRTLRVLV